MNPLPEELQAARWKLSKRCEYFSMLLWSLIPIEKSIGTMGVDEHLRLYYDPVAIKKWKPQELIGVLVHELGHVLKDHIRRGIPLVGVETGTTVITDPVLASKWHIAQIAMDCDNNPMVRDAGFSLPPDGVFPKDFKMAEGKFFEEYYAELLKNATVIKLPPGDGHCPHGKGGWKDPPPGGNTKTRKAGEVPGYTKAEVDAMRRHTAQSIRESKNRGNIPLGLDRWADELLTSKIPWQQELAGAVRHSADEVAGKQDFTFRRPSRRGAGSDLVFPTMRAWIPRIAYQIDTSGSMDAKEVARAVAEADGVIKTLGGCAEITAMSVDAEVHTRQRVSSARAIKLRGGGGTDMGVGIQAAQELRPRPDILIVVTDGYTPWPAEPPRRMKVIVVLVSSDGESPEWARTIVVKD